MPKCIYTFDKHWVNDTATPIPKRIQYFEMWKILSIAGVAAAPVAVMLCIVFLSNRYELSLMPLMYPDCVIRITEKIECCHFRRRKTSNRKIKIAKRFKQRGENGARNTIENEQL